MFNYTITEYACINATNNGIGDVNLCDGDFYEYFNESSECISKVYGVDPIINCSNGCTYYGDDKNQTWGGFCNANTTLNINTTSSIRNFNYSKNQCIVSNVKDYLCNNTLIDNDTLGVYCDLVTNMQPCAKHCITIIANRNTSQLNYFNTQKSCAIINEDKFTGINFLCTLMWVNPSYWLNAVLDDNDLGDLCSPLTFATIPVSKCSDNYTSIYDYVLQYPEDQFYVEGQCMNDPLLDTCTIGSLPSCYSTNQIQNCVLYADGVARQNLTTCTAGKSCTGGDCVVTPKPSADDNAKLTTAEKKIIASYVISFLFALMIAVALAVFTRNANVSFISFLITLSIGLIVFSILGWITIIYVVIACGIIALAVALIFKQIFLQSNQTQ
jgi:hypothetical protein